MIDLQTGADAVMAATVLLGISVARYLARPTPEERKQAERLEAERRELRREVVRRP